MLSIAPVASAGGAAAYYAGDNYYTDGQLTEASEWAGSGAAALGLDGKVERATFEAVLAGRLPNGSVIPDGTRGAHRAGIDLTFSAPKSVSLLAYVGGDRRLLDAHLAAVRTGLDWTEARLAEARVSKGRGQQVETTGNLVAALFQHDTSRALDPQAHIHAVIANATMAPDGRWRALADIALWRGKTAIASVYNAEFRQRVESLGYMTRGCGKHGQFEIEGVDRELITAFSQRRVEIEAAASRLIHNTPAAMQAVTLRTRGAKPQNIDRNRLHGAWCERATTLGFNPAALAATAQQLAKPGTLKRLEGVALNVVEQGAEFASKLGLSSPKRGADPLLSDLPRRSSSDALAAAYAVAAGVRHLSEREAGFRAVDLVKAALDLGGRVSVGPVEARIASLIEKGRLTIGADQRLMTSASAIAEEQRYLRAVRDGKGAAGPLLAPSAAHNALRDEARSARLRLTPGQRRAALSILASDDRVVFVQGDAGTGKSAMLAPVARLARAQGRPVLGLAVAHAVANRLRRDVGIETTTVASFLGRYSSASGTRTERGAMTDLAGAVLLVDEASLLGTVDATRIVELANAAGVARLVLVGDGKQLGAVAAGKPFALARGVDAPTMTENLRARTPEMRAIHGAAQEHDIALLAQRLEPHTLEAKEGAARAAAELWVGLPPAERARTSIFVSGRALRHAVNAEVQQLRRDAGELGERATILDTLVPVPLTREEQRHLGSYAPGQVIELARPLPGQRLPAGMMRIVAVERERRLRVELADGREAIFRPDRLAANRRDDALRLFDARPLTLHVGDPVRWTATDRARGLANNESAVLVAREPDALVFQTSDQRQMRLERDDPMLKRLDLAYALNAHAAQGDTADRAIVVAHSREGALINRALSAVLFTRAREQLTFVVDSLPHFTRRAQMHSGEKTSAVEIAEDPGVSRHQRSRGSDDRSANIQSGDRPPDQARGADTPAGYHGTAPEPADALARAPRPTSGGPVQQTTPPLPVKELELGL